MYIPKHYLETDRQEILDFIRKYSFGCIVTVKDNYPTATHLPFVLEEKDNELLLTSHFAKANPQWKEVIENDCLIVFSEPHAYISPSHYDNKESVPTWNYLAVHVYGKGELMKSDEESMMQLESMIRSFEAVYHIQWEQLSMEYKLKMMKGIVAFKIKVANIQAKKKLSQNKNQNERQRIISSLEKSLNSNENQIADYMRNLEKPK